MAGVERHDSFCVLCRSRCGARYVADGGRLIRVEPRPEHVAVPLTDVEIDA